MTTEPKTGAAPRPTGPEGPATASEPWPLRRILVALDQSDHANRAMEEMARLAAAAGARITGIHVYAARLHDRRFRQMEGGLPERYRRESEMERQRDVHEDLIGMGLGLISDSYHDHAGARAEAAGVAFERLSPEGKNYARLAEAAGSGGHDVIALGALGLGAVAGAPIGSTCERLVRRAPIDAFVARKRHLALGDGPVVVAVDGSDKSFGALMTGIAIARLLGAELRVIAAYDPYYHYVAFSRISEVLDEEAGKVFRFREQEELHEELIDDGIARIYQSHLNVAEKLARAAGAGAEFALLAGKPWRAIRRYLKQSGASLLVLGKTGVHADPGLDIGSTTENLLRSAPCHLWIGQTRFTPPADLVAEETIMWSDEAREMLARAPDFVRPMARLGVIRAAQEQGHTFITSGFVTRVMGRMMPGRGGDGGRDGGRGGSGGRGACAPEREALAPPAWSAPARARLEELEPALRDSVRRGAEKAARRDAASRVEPEHLTPFLRESARAPGTPPGAPVWSSAALARLNRVPEPFRERVRAAVERFAARRGVSAIGAEIEDAAFAAARQTMCPVPKDKP